jgi:hypothetical protein
MAFYIKPNRQPPRKPVSEVTAIDALEAFWYEIKPVFYAVFSIFILRSTYSQDSVIKIATLGILLFAASIIYSRLYHRGYIK